MTHNAQPEEHGGHYHRYSKPKCYAEMMTWDGANQMTPMETESNNYTEHNKYRGWEKSDQTEVSRIPCVYRPVFRSTDIAIGGE